MSCQNCHNCETDNKPSAATKLFVRILVFTLFALFVAYTVIQASL